MIQALSVDSSYREWVVALKGRIRSAQVKAAMTVNKQLLEMYWELGKEICEKEKGANWGDGLIEQLSRDLSTEFPGMKGFSRTNLFFIRKWYLFYQSCEIVSQVVRLIPWGHNREIMPAPQADLARETLKNPYNFDFLTLGKEVKERDVVQELVNK